MATKYKCPKCKQDFKKNEIKGNKCPFCKVKLTVIRGK